MREACGNPIVGSQEHFRFNLMIQSEGVRSPSMSLHLDIAECVTLVKLPSVSGSCLPIWKIGNNESTCPVGLLCGLNEVIHIKHLEHCPIHSTMFINISLYYNVASGQLLTPVLVDFEHPLLFFQTNFLENMVPRLIEWHGDIIKVSGLTIPVLTSLAWWFSSPDLPLMITRWLLQLQASPTHTILSKGRKES